MKLLLAASLATSAQASAWITGTYITGYWDCCKPSCSWRGKGNVNKPVRYCHKTTGLTMTNTEERDVCDGGTGTTCSDNQPFVVNSGLSMGFAAAAVGGVSGLNGDANCGQCYELRFMDTRHQDWGGHYWGGAHPDIVGKTHIVQVTNIGYDVSGEHSFDLQIPSAGMGAFTAGCPNQFPGYSGSAFDCGNNWGGCKSKSGCASLPPELQRGCDWRFDWFRWLISEGRTNNPYIQFRRVRCPSELTDISGTVPTDDGNFPAIDPSSYSSDSETTLPQGSGTTTMAPNGNRVTTTLSESSRCSNTGENCQATSCCNDASLACYEKNQFWAGCKATCTPGINPDDPVEYQQPWSCVKLSATTTSLLATTKTTTMSASTSALTTNTPAKVKTTTLTTSPPKSECSTIGESCLSTKCCADPSLVCYEKNQWWATCSANCVPGVDTKEPPQFQTPWSCAVLSMTTSLEAHSSKMITSQPTTTQTQTTTVSTTTGKALATEGIRSGDIIFLKTRSGSGKMLDMGDTTVQARWEARGTWQAVAIEKNGGGIIKSGDTVFLTAHTGARIDVEGEAVQARWEEKGTWQSMTIEKSGDGVILPGDVACLKAHTSKYIGVDDEDDGAVRARWETCAGGQEMQIEKEDARAIFSGSSVYLMAHTKKHLEVQNDLVQARYSDHGVWQRFRVENDGGRAIYSGDTVFLAAHTGVLVDVQGDAVSARWPKRGEWQALIVEKEGGGAIFPSDTIFLRAHTGSYIDVEGDAVKARWVDRGTWQSLVIQQDDGRRLQAYPTSGLEEVSEVSVSGPMVGIAIGLGAGLVLTCIVFIAGKQILSPNTSTNTVSSDKVHPATEEDNEFE